MTREATLIVGDGIGPEITSATLQVLDALGVEFQWDEQYGGMSAVEKAGTPLPDATLDSIRRTALAHIRERTRIPESAPAEFQIGIIRRFQRHEVHRAGYTAVPDGDVEPIQPGSVRSAGKRSFGG